MNSFGITLGKEVIHAKTPCRGSNLHVETCPFIVNLPIMNKNKIIDSYGKFCKACFSVHPNKKEPCNFTILHPGLKCRSEDCKSRFILCTKHHMINKDKLELFKDNLEDIGIKANIKLTNGIPPLM